MQPELSVDPGVEEATGAPRGERARRAAFRRLEERFPVNRGLRPVFLMLANAHPHAIDYIEQAPAIVAVATRGVTHVPSSERAFVEEQFAGLCDSGARLKDVMRAHGLPLPLRKLEAGVLTASRATAIRRLALMNPSTLAQVIPTTRQKQNAWLKALENWCSDMARRGEGGRAGCPFFEWAAINFAGLTYSEADAVYHLADFARAHLDTFNPRWSLAQARAREQAWHEELALAETPKRGGAGTDAVIDYGPLPASWEGDGFRFTALQTGKALRVEGAAMHHCVASYWHQVATGRSRIYSIRAGGNRVATLELSDRVENYRWGRGGFQVRQLVGPCNARPAPGIARVVDAFVKEINGTA